MSRGVFTMRGRFFDAKDVKYFLEFNWGGETWVISHPWYGGKRYRASHKAIGWALPIIPERTIKLAEAAAVKFLESQGIEKLKKTIRKARRLQKVDGYPHQGFVAKGERGG